MKSFHFALLAAALSVGACADGNGLLTTATVSPGVADKAAAEKAAARQQATACASLATRIDQLKGDGTVERLETAANGKTTTVRVKRDALARQAELNKAYGDYRASCGIKAPIAAAAQPSTLPQAQNVPANQSLVGPVAAAAPARSN